MCLEFLGQNTGKESVTQSEHSGALRRVPLKSIAEYWSVQAGMKTKVRASLVVQWLRIRLPMQGTGVRALVREDPTCCGATKPVRHNYRACALEPASSNYWSLCATTTEARKPRACALQQEKPPQWEARAPQQRVAPALSNYRKTACKQRHNAAKKKKKKKRKRKLRSGKNH